MRLMLMLNKNNSIVSLSIAILLIAILSSNISRIKFDYELENFFPLGDPDLVYYENIKNKFGADNDLILISLSSSHGVFNTEFLNKYDKLTFQLSNLEHTISTRSLTNIDKVIQTPLSVLKLPYLHIEDNDRLKEDSVRLNATPSIHHFFISKDQRSIKLIVYHKPLAEKQKADDYLTEINQTLDSFSFEETHIIGKIVAQKTFVDEVKQDFSYFLLASFFFIFLLLLVFMRNITLIIATLFIAGFAVSTTLGVMVLFGKRIDVLSSLIPSILLVVAMSDMIHLFTRIRQESLDEKPLRQAINIAIKTVGPATFLTSFTTAIGFLTLITINVIPIIDLGIYAALGIMITFIITYLCFPQITYLKNIRIGNSSKYFEFQKHLDTLFSFILHRKKVLMFFWSILLIVIIGGIFQLKFNAYLIDELPINSDAKVDFKYFDDDFAGTRPFTMSLWVMDSSASIYSSQVINEIANLEQSLQQSMKVGDLISPVSYVKSANQSLHNGMAKFYCLPKTEQEWQKAFRFINKYRPERKAWKVSDKNEAVVMGFYKDEGSQIGITKSTELINKLSFVVNKEIIGYRLTGTSLLIDKSQKQLPINLVKGLFTALIIVSLIAAWLFRSWKMTLITLIPNLMPLLVTAGIMGYFGIPINLSTSIIFAISFGIVVDDTIHFLMKFKEEYSSGKSKQEAISLTIRCTGEPIILTSIILTVGFMVFCFSSFSATFYTGLFVSIAFVVAVFADLILLPILILQLLPNHKDSESV